jgi:hypothetical protein
MTDLTPLDIGAIEQRAAAASRGSWLLAENAEFINAALIDVPLLVAEVRRLRAQQDAAEKALLAVGKAALVVKTTLDKPYPDAPETTPWKRFMERPARDAYNLGNEFRAARRATLGVQPEGN